MVGYISDVDIGVCDAEVADVISAEFKRQNTLLQMIASENFVSRAVLQAQGSILTNKYAEGYAGSRYYCGCEFVDVAENLAVERLCRLFGCRFANVQPHSGSQANQQVFMALLKPGDTILGMSLDCGGHLTHGAAPNVSGRWFNAVSYGVDKNTGLLDMDEVESLALSSKPALIIAGASSYPRKIDFAAFRAIADKVGAYFLADIAHYSGLIAAGCYPSPFGYAHVVTSTTHKTLRGPRGAVIMTDDEEMHKKIKSSVFPGMQGGPLMHVIAAKAVAFKEALHPDFRLYAQQVLANSRALAGVLSSGGLSVVTGGTDSHLIVLDLRERGVTGRDASSSLERAGIVCNKNAVPFDTAKPWVTSGIRLGAAAETSRGLGVAEFEEIGRLVIRTIDALSAGKEDMSVVEAEVRSEVSNLVRSLPMEAFPAHAVC
ncbi:serine hydroxymethyltransferase [Anaplasma capra]|uniref:serine hydroxymethyltransferase n=1 Tax=Anaplasma capra TaxID=1562740 RepID=UPI0021D614E5|nr:serine hydroxymethyltransferase [Anaplasma capra]MCU7611716.1 serine hydroxymethyltransferase [Anaplasma capra]MCU7612533.1 serine hydroxymethyltransferase [Anaplasma capra]